MYTKDVIEGEKVNHRKKDTCVAQLVAWIVDLSKADKLPLVVVDVSGIARLPKLSIEDISEVAMCERLRRLEAHISSIDESLAIHTTDISDMKEKSLPVAVRTVPTSDVINSATSNRDTPDVVVVSGTETIIVKQPAAVPIIVKDITHHPAVDEPGDPPAQALMSDVMKNGLQDKENGSWSRVADPRRRKQSAIKQKGVLFGRAKDSIIKSVIRPKSIIYLGDIDPEVKCADIKDYLNGADISIENVFCVSPLSAQTKSFKIIVKPADYSKVFNEDLWNEGTRIREWKPY